MTPPPLHIGLLRAAVVGLISALILVGLFWVAGYFGFLLQGLTFGIFGSAIGMVLWGAIWYGAPLFLLGATGYAAAVGGQRSRDALHGAVSTTIAIGIVLAVSRSGGSSWLGATVQATGLGAVLLVAVVAGVVGALQASRADAAPRERA